MERIERFYTFISEAKKKEDLYWKVDDDKFYYWRPKQIEFTEDELVILDEYFPDLFYNETEKSWFYHDDLVYIYLYKTEDEWYFVKCMLYEDFDFNNDDDFEAYEDAFEYYQCDTMEGLVKFLDWYYPN